MAKTIWEFTNANRVYTIFSKKGVLWAEVDRQRQALGAELLLPHRE